MNIFSHASLLCSIIYLYLGIYALQIDIKKRLNRAFFFLCLCFTIWAFSFSFMYSASSKEACWYWYKIATIGVCFFPGTIMQFILILTQRTHMIKKIWLNLILFFPAVVFVYKSFLGNFLAKGFELNSFGWMKINNDKSIWFWFFVAYYMAFSILSLMLCLHWGIKSKIRHERKQALIFTITGSIVLLIASLSDIILPLLNIDFPMISPITLIIWAVGLWYAIIKHGLMILTPSIAADKILETIVDSVILVSPESTILNVNYETERLLGYSQEELLGKPLKCFYDEDKIFDSNDIIKLLREGPIRNFELFFVTKSGRKVPIMLSASEIKGNDDSILGAVVVSRDITDLKNAENRLKHLAHYDYLTDLPNRVFFNTCLKHALEKSKRAGGSLALMLIDLDRFKEVNDVLGHKSGDILLKEVAERLKKSLCSNGIVSRLGGDEFTIVLDDIQDKSKIEETANTILQNITVPFIINGKDLHVTASIGISIYPSDGEDADILIKHADLAMYNAKSVRDSYQMFNLNMSKAVAERTELESSLRKALERNEFVVFYQPIVDLFSGNITGMEALVRWLHPELGIVSPLKFIPIAEESGLIIPLGEWVLRTACNQCKLWQEITSIPLTISVNISALQFRQKDLVGKITEILKKAELHPTNLQLEITESTIMCVEDNLVDTLQRIHDIGTKISIDDFGTGFSCLSNLRRFPIDSIKIDKSFIQEITSKPDDAAIVKAIIALAESIKMKVIAEGVENVEQLEFLRSLNWDYIGTLDYAAVQGYFFSKPLPAESMEKMLLKNQ